MAANGCSTMFVRSSLHLVITHRVHIILIFNSGNANMYSDMCNYIYIHCQAICRILMLVYTNFPHQNTPSKFDTAENVCSKFDVIEYKDINSRRVNRKYQFTVQKKNRLSSTAERGVPLEDWLDSNKTHFGTQPS